MRYFVIRPSTQTVHALDADTELQAVSLAQQGYGVVEPTKTAPEAADEPVTGDRYKGLSDEKIAALPPIMRMTKAQLNAVGDLLVKSSTKETLKRW